MWKIEHIWQNELDNRHVDDLNWSRLHCRTDQVVRIKPKQPRLRQRYAGEIIAGEINYIEAVKSVEESVEERNWETCFKGDLLSVKVRVRG